MRDEEAKCANCGSEKNVITHHLSYDPEITAPLCQSCHAKFHFSKNPAKVYRTVGRKSSSVYGLFLKNYNIGTVTGEGIHCLLCVFDGTPSDALNRRYDNEKGFWQHLIEEHFPVDWSDFDILKLEGEE